MSTTCPNALPCNANYSVVDNKGTGTRFVVGGAGNNVTTPGSSSTGIEFGIRHAF